MKTERQSNSVCLKYWQWVLIPQAAALGQVHCTQTLNTSTVLLNSLPLLSKHTQQPTTQNKTNKQNFNSRSLSIRIAGDRTF